MQRRKAFVSSEGIARQGIYINRNEHPPMRIIARQGIHHIL
jgi:hypothetical protein